MGGDHLVIGSLTDLFDLGNIVPLLSFQVHQNLWGLLRISSHELLTMSMGFTVSMFSGAVLLRTWTRSYLLVKLYECKRSSQIGAEGSLYWIDA